MQGFPPQESRKILDAMGIPVVVLRDRQPDATDDDHRTPEASSPMPQMASELVRPLVSESGVDNDSIDPKASESNPQIDSTLPSESVESQATVDAQPIRLSLVSAVSDDTLLACELPEWAGGLLEGRLTGLCSDLMRALSPMSQESDWQYFHWPIAGIKDQSESAALEALDAWLHRRWAETTAQDPTIVLAVSRLDLSSIFGDALILPTLDELAVSADRKRHAWHVIQESRRA